MALLILIVFVLPNRSGVLALLNLYLSRMSLQGYYKMYPRKWTQSENSKPRKMDTSTARVYNKSCIVDTAAKWSANRVPKKGENYGCTTQQIH